MTWALALAAYMLTAVSCAEPTTEGTRTLGPGDRLPAFEVTMNDGTRITGDMMGRGLCLVTFFNTGCPDCREALPALQAAYDIYAEEVLFVTVARDETPASVEDYWKKNGYTIPYNASGDRTVYNMFAERGIPRMFLSQDGIITKTWDKN